MQIKLFFGFIIIVLFGIHPLKAQVPTTEQNLSWFTSFFSERKQLSAGDQLAQNEALIEEANLAQDSVELARLFKEQAMLYLFHARELDLAMEFFIKALTVEENLHLENEKVFTHLGMAKVFEDVLDFERATQALNDALDQNERHKDYNILFYILNQKGRIGVQKNDTTAALNDFKQALAIQEHLDEPERVADVLSSMAHLYQKQGNYNSALDYFKKALSIRREFQNRMEEASTLNDAGELYSLMKNDSRALANHEASLTIRQSLKDKAGIAQSLNNIGEIYYRQKKYQLAAEYLMRGLDAAREAQDQNMVRKSYEYLSSCFREAGDLKKALYYNEELIKITDFIHSERDGQLLLSHQTRYQLEKRDSEIENLNLIKKQREAELEQAEFIRNVLIVIVALVVTIVFLFYNLYRAKRSANRALKEVNITIQQQNEQLHDLNATKDKFFSIISHDLKGPLNSLTSFSGLLINHAGSLSKEEIQMLAQDLDKSLKNLFALLENLLEWSRSQTGALEFTPEDVNLTDVLQQNKELLDGQAALKNIQLTNQVTARFIIHANKNSITTVFRNLISNAIKFTPPEGKITLHAEIKGNEIVTSIADTGVGMSKEVMQKLFRIDTKHTTKGTANEKGTGLGLILCKDFVEKNGGRIWVESEPGKGSLFYVALPLKK